MIGFSIFILSKTFIVTPTFAQSVTPNPTKEARKEANQQKRVPTLIARGDSEIAKKLVSLHAVIFRIQALKK